MLAIVLSRRDFREFDQMISVYTKEKGKLNLLARGVKKITSKNALASMPKYATRFSIAIKKMLGKPSEKVPASILQKHGNVEIFCNEDGSVNSEINSALF